MENSAIRCDIYLDVLTNKMRAIRDQYIAGIYSRNVCIALLKQAEKDFDLDTRLKLLSKNGMVQPVCDGLDQFFENLHHIIRLYVVSPILETIEGLPLSQNVPDYIKKLQEVALTDDKNGYMVISSLDRVAQFLNNQKIEVTSELLRKFVQKNGDSYSEPGIAKAMKARFNGLQPEKSEKADTKRPSLMRPH